MSLRLFINEPALIFQMFVLRLVGFGQKNYSILPII